MKSARLKKPGLIVVGRNSYIGGYLLEHAQRAGLKGVIGLASADCNFLNATAVSKFFKSLRPGEYTVVFLAVINKQVRNSFDSFVENVTMVRNLAAGCRLANVASLIYFSSVDVYGNQPDVPITESSPIAPDTWYGLAKYAGEWILSSSRELDCPVTVLRIPGIYGLAKNDPSVIGRMAADFKRTGRIRIHGRGCFRRDYVFVGDIARLVLALGGAKHNGVLNVATCRSRPMLEIARTVGEALGGRVDIVHEPANASRDFDLVFDNSRLRSVLPDFRFTDLRAGMRSYLTGGAATASATKGAD